MNNETAYSRSGTGVGLLAIGVIIFIAAVIVVSIAGAIISVTVHEEKNITVQEKLGAHGEGGGYQVIDTDGNVYSVEDNLLLGSFDASNRYAKLKADHQYHVKTFGIRNTFLTWYPNILEINEV
jgi:hypothetical protein